MAAPPPPPPPAPKFGSSAPPPPPGIPGFSKSSSGKGQKGETDRKAMLSDIRNFKKSGVNLKKTVTNDRSAPLLAGKTRASDGNNSSSNISSSNSNSSANNSQSNSSQGQQSQPFGPGAGLFAGGFPTLRKTGLRKTMDIAESSGSNKKEHGDTFSQQKPVTKPKPKVADEIKNKQRSMSSHLSQSPQKSNDNQKQGQSGQIDHPKVAPNPAKKPLISNKQLPPMPPIPHEQENQQPQLTKKKSLPPSIPVQTNSNPPSSHLQKNNSQKSSKPKKPPPVPSNPPDPRRYHTMRARPTARPPPVPPTARASSPQAQPLSLSNNSSSHSINSHQHSNNTNNYNKPNGNFQHTPNQQQQHHHAQNLPNNHTNYNNSYQKQRIQVLDGVTIDREFESRFNFQPFEKLPPPIKFENKDKVYPSVCVVRSK